MKSTPPFSKLSGLIASTFTPMHHNGDLNLKAVPQLVNHLIDQQISCICVCSGTGEGMSLTIRERKQILEAFLEAADGRIPVIVQVGHNSLYEARGLATHAADVGATAITLIPPTYHKPRNIDQLIKSVQVVASGAIDLPLIYHHAPAISGFELEWPEFLRRSIKNRELPSLAGIKFNGSRLADLKTCADDLDDHIRLFYGTDERMLDGMITGAHAAIGSTYNFAAPLYHSILDLYEQGKVDEARHLQNISFAITWAFINFGIIDGQKAIMKMIGLDCGPPRLPGTPLSTSQAESLRNKLEKAGFFNWV